MSGRNEVENTDHRALRAALADEASGGDLLAAHPIADTLLAYLEGTLEGAEAERIADHLVACRECGRAAIDLGDFASGETEEVAEFATVAAWRAFKEHLPEQDASARSRPSPNSRSTLHWPSRALAASLVVACLGLLLWGGALRRSLGRAEATVVELEAAQLEVPILYLEGAVRDQAAAVAEIARRAGPGRFLIVLTPPPGASFRGLAVEVVDSVGRPLWSASDLDLSEYGTLRIGLSRAQLPAGDFLLLLRDRSGDLLAEYPLRLSDH